MYHERGIMRATDDILRGISEAMRGLDPSQVEEMLEVLLPTKTEGRKVLVVGAGRSGLVGRAFAMRLMHLDFEVYVMGETITPTIEAGDLVLIISGSGRTTLPVTVAEMAKRLGSRVLVVTSYPFSALGMKADCVVVVSGREMIAHEEEYHTRQILGEHESLAPMGTIFENACMVFLDSIIAELMARLNISEKEMKRKHTTIE